MFSYSKARELAYSALDYRSLRQDLISSNIANVDTPFYRPKDINFEDVMTKQAKEIFNGGRDLELKLAKTSGMHLDPAGSGIEGGTIFFRDGHMARNDGNSVDLDVETSELAKNGIMYTALISSLRQHGAIFKNAIDAHKNL